MPVQHLLKQVYFFGEYGEKVKPFPGIHLLRVWERVSANFRRVFQGGNIKESAYRMQALPGLMQQEITFQNQNI